MTDPQERVAVVQGDENVADAVAEALAKYAVAYSHVTLVDMRTAGQTWKVHEVLGGNPFDRNDWLGEFGNKADAHAFCAKLRRDAAVQAAARHRQTSTAALEAEIGRSGDWREVEQEALRKGLRRSPKYYPAIGETCRMSGPNCDDADGYTWGVVEVLWRDDLFIVTRVSGCWPTVTKLELALFEPARLALAHQETTDGK